MENTSTFTTFISELKKQFELQLPGALAQKDMAPEPDIENRFDESGRSHARKSAVMILLYANDDQIEFPLIVRQQYAGVHSGQVALPGGKYEPSDEDLIQTALRETHEEIGINPEHIDILGTLSELFVPPSNFNILPVVGYTSIRPNFKPQEKEVNQIILTDLHDLNNPTLKKHKKMTFFNNTEVEVPYFDIQGHVVWGATAMILAEFAHLTHLLTIDNINELK